MNPTEPIDCRLLELSLAIFYFCLWRNHLLYLSLLLAQKLVHHWQLHLLVQSVLFDSFFLRDRQELFNLAAEVGVGRLDGALLLCPKILLHDLLALFTFVDL